MAWMCRRQKNVSVPPADELAVAGLISVVASLASPGAKRGRGEPAVAKGGDDGATDLGGKDLGEEPVPKRWKTTTEKNRRRGVESSSETSPASATTAQQPGASLALCVGERVDALGQDNLWAKAGIVAVEAGQVRVHFTGFAKKYDEWIPIKDGGSRRLTLLGTVTDAVASDADGQQQEELADDDSQDSDDEPEGPARSRRRGASGRGRPALQAGKQRKPKWASKYVGVSWDKKNRKWGAKLYRNGKTHHLGRFGDEREAARAVDTAARRLRGDDAHGGRAVGSDSRERSWNRLNFPTDKEVKRAKQRGALLTEEDKADAAATSERQGPSEYVGVSWSKKRRKWTADIYHDGKMQYLGGFDDEHEAARAVDTAARRLRGEDAHGGQSRQGNLLRLNFPTEGEVTRAQERCALLTEEDRAAAAASERQGPSKFVGVGWDKKARKWWARINHGGKRHSLGQFDDEREAARAVDTAARRLRGEDAHGGRSARGNQVLLWFRLNFPTKREVEHATALDMPST